MKGISFQHVLLGLSSLFQISASSPYRPHVLPLPSRVIAQFPEPVWLENIAVRSNGDLLVTLLQPNASIYQICNPSGREPHVSLVHTFTEVTSVLGISEISPDVFAVVGFNFTSPLPTATTVFSIDFNRPKPVIKTIVAIPEAVLPNGMTSLTNTPTTILIADSYLGLVWRVNTLTGKYDRDIKRTEMAIATGSTKPIGINGLHVHDGYLYFDNSFLATLYRVKITTNGSVRSNSAVETVVVLDAVFCDDFTFAADGTIYAATNNDNRVIAVKPNGKGGYGRGVVVAGSKSSLRLAGDTSAAFGRTKRDKRILYVTTSGIYNGTTAEGGKVVAIDTTKF
ncbi:hypothetical protein ABW20_dc0110338 [Dactylellina cionopaga]|nr:hypothetical protein ABW20_dc0110338 [Dactylellina cionopaga]